MTMITPSYLGETIEYSSLHACRSTLEDPTASLRELTRDALVSALKHARGNRLRAARILGVSRTTLYRMLVRFGLESFGREREDLRDDQNDDGFAARHGLRLVKA